MEQEFKVLNNKGRSRFEIALGDDFAFTEYRYYEGSIALMHTVVPPQHGGKGLATKLISFAFNFAQDNNLPVMVYCPFAADYVKKHPETLAQLDKKFHNPAKR